MFWICNGYLPLCVTKHFSALNFISKFEILRHTFSDIPQITTATIGYLLILAPFRFIASTSFAGGHMKSDLCIQFKEIPRRNLKLNWHQAEITDTIKFKDDPKSASFFNTASFPLSWNWWVGSYWRSCFHRLVTWVESISYYL